MHFDREDVSSKSAGLAAIFCLLFGFLGAHRFYVGKYITGFIYLAFGVFPIGMTIASQLFGLKGILASILISICVFLAMLYDMYALYSESFFDSNGKILLSGSIKDELFGRTYEEKFIDRLSIIAALLLFSSLITLTFVYLHVVKFYILQSLN